MRAIGVSLAAVLVMAGCLPARGQGCPAPEESGQKGAVPLCAVVNQVRSALQAYQQSLGPGKDALPPLARADFHFKTAAATSVGGKISLFVFTLGASRADAATTGVDFSYELPPPSHGTATPHGTPSLRDQLYATIRGAAEQVQMANTLGTLAFSKLVVSISFGVKWDGSAGAAAPISVVTVGLNGDKSRETVQSVELTFARPGKQD